MHKIWYIALANVALASSLLPSLFRWESKLAPHQGVLDLMHRNTEKNTLKSSSSEPLGSDA